jgi:hypothetical protein
VEAADGQLASGMVMAATAMPDSRQRWNQISERDGLVMALLAGWRKTEETPSMLEREW